jgi:ABC-2 type transport system permease protein
MMSDLFLLRSTLRNLLRAKQLIAAAVLVLTPCLLALAWRAIAPTRSFQAGETYDRLSEAFIFGFLTVISTCVFATQMISQEVEQKTIVYLLTRPVPRWRILLAKFVATVVVTTAAAWLASLALALAAYGGHGWGASRLGRDLLISPVACLSYSALFLLLATLSNRPLLLGLLYAFGVETWLPALPGDFKRLSLLAYLRVLAPHTATSAAAVTGGGDLLGVPAAAGDGITPLLAWGVVLAVTIISLLVACLLFSSREYVPREDL